MEREEIFLSCVWLGKPCSESL